MDVSYPYIPDGKTIKYVPMDNEFIQAAKTYACQHSLDKKHKTGSVVVKNREIIGSGANGSDYHEHNECERVKQNVPSGEGYELCEGCHPKNHSEPAALADAQKNDHQTQGADLYLWGHWWCCEPCWNTMTAGGINQVYLAEGSEKLFDKNHSEHIIGNQCDI
jgi:deoxycytidylate deaminase